MIKRSQIFVRAKNKAGKWVNADVLDLDDESFRAFVMWRLMEADLVCSLKDYIVLGEPLVLRTRT